MKATFRQFSDGIIEVDFAGLMRFQHASPFRARRADDDECSRRALDIGFPFMKRHYFIDYMRLGILAALGKLIIETALRYRPCRFHVGHGRRAAHSLDGDSRWPFSMLIATECHFVEPFSLAHASDRTFQGALINNKEYIMPSACFDTTRQRLAFSWPSIKLPCAARREQGTKRYVVAIRAFGQ